MKLGAVRLRDLLYFADMKHYAKTGHPMTGATYIKREFGPVPRELEESLHRLGHAKKLLVKLGGNPLDQMSMRYHALAEPDVAHFSAEEISLVEGLLQSVCREPISNSISKASRHEALRLAEIGEELPYEAFLINQFAEINEDDIAWAEKVSKSRRNRRASKSK